MRIYDTMARARVALDLPPDRVVRVFVCGPTVQDNFHIGHARTYIFFDALVKYLRNSGHRVFYLQNITDIDDKIIDRANSEGVSFDVISRRYTDEFHKIMSMLRVDSVNFFAHATDHIPEILAQISILVHKGIAYETEDGVYFDISKFPEYGKLWGQNPDTLLSSSETSGTKRNPRDFAIWKKLKPGEPYWDSPWGRGRPGWHIEDTAITDRYFGPVYDIHGGGMDLIFPHHDAEIAIERSISGKDRLADYWIHTGMINVNDEKMSKSLRNFVTIREVLKSYRAEDLRFALLNANFSSSLNYSESLLQEARRNVSQISILYNKVLLKLGDRAKYRKDYDLIASLDSIIQDNMDFRGLFRDVIRLVSSWNVSLENLGTDDLNQIYSVLKWVDSFAGILRRGSADITVSGTVNLLLNIRKELRAIKQYQLADSIRSRLLEMGVYIEDNGSDTAWWINSADEGDNS
ncbi:MAG: cysteine--tRNA ligase [Thermoplasmataceae archaeon]